MKRTSKTNFNSSIKELMNHINTEMYTKQTLVSLFRCLLETVIENRYDSTVLIKLNDTQSFSGLLNRLKYSDLKVYFYSDNLEYETFNQIKLDKQALSNDEFVLIVGENFSASLFWNETSIDIPGLCNGFCSLNPYDARQITEYLQTVTFNEELKQDLSNIKQDRRRNENFTLLLRKIVASLECGQRDLICANTELKELNEKTLQTEKLAAIGQLCSTIAHELRNPLSSMDLYAKIIVKNVEKIGLNAIDPQILESLANAASCISNATVGLERILTELVDYSKPMQIEMIDEDLAPALSEVINLVKPSVEKKGVKLSFCCSLSKDIRVKFDKVKLNQAVLNIIKNALEVSEENNTVNISVNCRDNDDTVYIKVQDQGCGILTENMEKIFTPYFSTKKEGTGLGLAQARKIMEAHDGSLVIMSTSPNGTTFGLTLPLQQSQFQ